ncbi:MAG: hypothetical protein SV186_01635 [Candidatus Nanohaloarchaea archaeon]|nr:hypothetical protein [Candidatus Nanohaloarchaea archaeon]
MLIFGEAIIASYAVFRGNDTLAAVTFSTMAMLSATMAVIGSSD